MKKFVKVEVQAVKKELNAQANDLMKRSTFGEFTKTNKMNITEVPTSIPSELEA